MDKLSRNSNEVAKGSIYDIASSKGLKTEEVLAEADVIVILDVSSSMMDRNRAGLTRYERAKESLGEIQRAFPGRVAVISFSDKAQIELTGLPPMHGGCTNMAKALNLAKDFDGLDTKFYFISDGSPTDSESTIISIADSFTDPISTIFIGSDTDTTAIAFMKKLAEVTGGTNSGKVDPAMLGNTILQLVANNGN